MTIQTRTIANKPGHDAGHINRVTLRAEPWDTPPEAKKDHPRPAPGKLEAVSLRTPQVARVRAPCPDRFADLDQDLLAKQWQALCQREGHRSIMPPRPAMQRESARRGAETRKPGASQIMIDLLERLRHGDIRRSELLSSRVSRNATLQRKRAFELGWIKGGSHPDSLITITTEGYAALQAMRREHG
jgi:hypothetical protein